MCAQWRLRSAWAGWSESSLCAQWVAKDPSFLRAHSEDSDRLGGCPGWSESSLGAHAILLVLSRGGLFGPPLQGSINFIGKRFVEFLFLLNDRIKFNIIIIIFFFFFFFFFFQLRAESHVVCEQRMRRSACLSAQISQRLYYSLPR